ncbi:type IV pilus modification PilV family protein [Telluria beijingensis]|uniref:type IV pilus modification PilV family protein n=1 Tax=Telluria beijingensis TaxID=3068633 RepID=UPI002795C00C|nr:prepilin-type N-terminal cleavage/methylation domain-containing protein [Massilia sp. REN29]
MSNKRRMAGVTLVELIVAIVIVGAALAGLVAAYNRASVASADPLVTQQMLAIAESMMEEVMLKPYAGDGTKGATRASYDEIGDYANYAAQAVTDADGVAIAGLGRYKVSVAVDPLATALPGVPAAQARRINVTVTHGGESLTLSGWRTQP